MIGSWLARLSPWREVPSRERDDGECGTVVEDALGRRRDALSTRPEVDSLSSALRAHRERNHFGESLERIYGEA